MSSSTTQKTYLVEAARYALLRRLAPTIRHNMAGALQPVGMVAAMLEKRLQKPHPDWALLAKNSSDIGELSREAAATCIDLMGWLAPKDKDLVALTSGVEDALGLLATELSFGGFHLRNQVGPLPTRLPREVLRSVLMASLLALSDAAEEPGDLVVTAKTDDGETLLMVELTPNGSGSSLNSSHAYRKMQWADVQALAEAEGVTCQWTKNRVELRYRAPVVVI